MRINREQLFNNATVGAKVISSTTLLSMQHFLGFSISADFSIFTMGTGNSSYLACYASNDRGLTYNLISTMSMGLTSSATTVYKEVSSYFWGDSIKVDVYAAGTLSNLNVWLNAKGA